MKNIIFIITTLWLQNSFASEHLLVVNKDGDSLSVLDSKTGITIQTVETGKGPHEVAVTPNQKQAIVTNYGYGCGSEAGSSLTVVNLDDYSSYQVNLGSHRSPHGIQALKDNKTVAVTVECNDAVLLVDIQSKKIIQAIETQANVSHMLVLSKDEKLAFAANIGSGSVSVVDFENEKLIKNIQTGSGAEGIDISDNGESLWVTNRDNDTVSVIDVTRLEIDHTIDVKKMPIRIKLHQEKDLALVSNAQSATLAFIDTKSMKVVKQLSMTEETVNANGNVFRSGPVPIGIVYSDDGDYAFVANTNVDEIRKIRLDDYKVEKILTAGKRPDGLAVVQANQ